MLLLHSSLVSNLRVVLLGIIYDPLHWLSTSLVFDAVLGLCGAYSFVPALQIKILSHFASFTFTNSSSYSDAFSNHLKTPNYRWVWYDIPLSQTEYAYFVTFILFSLVICVFIAPVSALFSVLTREKAVLIKAT